MFLGSQKSFKEIDKNIKTKESKEVLTTSKNIEGVKKSAEILKLEATNIELETPEVTTKKDKIEKIDKIEPTKEKIISTTNMLDKMVLTKNTKSSKPIIHINNLTQIKKIEPQDELSSTVKNDVVELNIPVNTTSQNIQTKIISARQHLSTMMSEIAQKMYQNYKPPVTAFKMNLNPNNLGSIAITMKNNKADKTMNISMNMSNNGTLEVFMENKNALHNALQKTFNDPSSNISLNFGMQDQSSNQSFEQFKQEQKNIAKEDEIVLDDELDEEVEKEANQDYM
jgi:hypothetical protein